MAAENANKPPRSAGKFGGIRFAGDELFTRQTTIKTCKAHADWRLFRQILRRASPCATDSQRPFGGRHMISHYREPYSRIKRPKVRITSAT